MIFKRKIYNELLQWKRTDEGRTAVLIQGARRVGKSTIAKLIVGLWDVKGGSITLGDVDVRSMTQADYNRYIAYVSQDNYLFDTSAERNG